MRVFFFIPATVLIVSCLLGFASAQSGWIPIPAVVEPNVEQFYAFDSDPTRGVSVLFGGRDPIFAVQDGTWVFGGSQTWTQVSPTTRPTARASMDMAYNPARDVYVLFGGENIAQRLDDTWEFDGQEWSTVFIPTALRPVARSEHAMAHDPLTGETLMFGGRTQSLILRNDLWAFDGTSWTNRAPVSFLPPARSDMRLVYDSARGVHVTFGGRSIGTSASDETWEYSSATNAWTQVMTPTLPPGRYRYAMEYDANRGVMVMHGGVGLAGNLGDTWEYDGTDWTQVITPNSPGARIGANFATGATGLFFFGGFNFQDTWIYGSSPVVTPGTGGDCSLMISADGGPSIAPTRPVPLANVGTFALSCRSLGGSLDFAPFALIATGFAAGGAPTGLSLLGSGPADVWVDPANAIVLLDGLGPPSSVFVPTLVPGGLELGPYNVPFGLAGQFLNLQVFASDPNGSPVGLSTSDAVTLRFQ